MTDEALAAQRPQHPDFWQLAAIVTANDQAADNGASLEHIIASHVADPESVRYVSQQRAMRAVRLLRMVSPQLADQPRGPLITTSATAWIDGFLAGVDFRDGQQ